MRSPAGAGVLAHAKAARDAGSGRARPAPRVRSLAVACRPEAWALWAGFPARIRMYNAGSERGPSRYEPCHYRPVTGIDRRCARCRRPGRGFCSRAAPGRGFCSRAAPGRGFCSRAGTIKPPAMRELPSKSHSFLYLGSLCIEDVHMIDRLVLICRAGRRTLRIQSGPRHLILGSSARDKPPGTGSGPVHGTSSGAAERDRLQLAGLLATTSSCARQPAEQAAPA
jgi:hypothetical protein